MNEKENLIQSHGLTQGQMTSIARQQSGQTTKKVRRVQANNLDVLNDKYFQREYGSYMIDEHDQHLFHVAQEMRSFNPKNGQKISKPIVQKYSQDDFKRMRDMNAFSGYTLAIIHDPRKNNDAGTIDIDSEDLSKLQKGNVTLEEKLLEQEREIALLRKQLNDSGAIELNVDTGGAFTGISEGGEEEEEEEEEVEFDQPAPEQPAPEKPKTSKKKSSTKTKRK